MLPIEDDDLEQPFPIVYLQDEQVFGIIVTYGAYFSKVKYQKGGTVFEVLVENDDILDGD